MMIAKPYELVIPYKNSRNERRSWLAPSQIPKTFTYPPLPQLQELSEPFPRSYLAALRHRVEAALVPRAAFKQPRCGEIRPYYRAVYFQSFGGVLRAARIKTAFAASEQRRDGRLIKADGEQQNQSERTTYQPRFESTPQSAPGQSFVRSPRRFMHAARS